MGDGVNVASRIQSLGQANTILISSEILSKIRNHPEFSTVLIGPFEFKNIEEPMLVYAISNPGLDVPEKESMSGKLKETAKAGAPGRAWWIIGAALVLTLAALLSWWLVSEKHNRVKGGNGQSIAVLYFDNLSGDPSQDYFSAGMTEEIISRLSNIPDLRVKSRQSVMQYRGKSVPARKIARELGVGDILQGSVRKQGNQVLITVQLVDGATEETRWSLSYNRELSDVFDVQSDIAQQVATRLNIGFSAETRKRLTTPPTRNVQAYDLYLKAIADSEMESGIGGTAYNRLAIGKLKQAISLDTAFADAYARLGILYTYIAANDRQPAIWLDSARYYSEKAIAVDPGKEQGFIALANVEYLQGRQDECLRNLVKAEGIRPFSTTQAMTTQLIEKHAFGEAWEWLEKARRHDPADPLPHAIEAWIFLTIDMLDSAKSRFDAFRAHGGLPGAMEQPLLHYYLYTSDEEGYRTLGRKIYAGDEKQFAYAMGRYYLFRRRWPLADSFFRASSRPDQMDMGLIDLHLGRVPQGRQLLQKTIDARLSFMGYAHAWHAYDISRCYAALDDQRFVDYFQKALNKGWFDYTWLEEDPFFDPVREDPVFKAMWKQVQADNARYQLDLRKSMEKMRNGANP
jgi:TolB-like protein/tetratricopeptide (TPR) repeat protein